MTQEFGSFGNRPIVSASQAAKKLGRDAIGPANCYVCPRGAGPGEAWVLMLYPDVQIVQQFQTGYQPPFQKLVLGCDVGLTFDQMLFLSAEKVSPGNATDPNCLYICHLADIRWLMLRTMMFKSYNVRSMGNPTAEYWSDTENPAAATLYNGNSGPGVGPWTWQTMIQDIFAQLPSWVQESSVSAAFPSQNPERFRFIEESPLIATCDALRMLFMDLVYNPINAGSFSIVQLGQTDNNFQQLLQASQSSLLDQTNVQDSLATYFPGSVDVLFPALYLGTPEQALTVYPYYVLNRTPSQYPSGSAVVNTVDQIIAPLDAQMPCSGPVDTPAYWQASTAYALGAKVQPTPPNTHTYVCTTAGTSGSSEPAFPTSTGATVSDGSVVWSEQTIYPTNFSAMQSLANTLCSNYYQFLDGTERRKVWEFTGIQPFVPGSQVGEVRWSLDERGATTTVAAVEGDT